MPDSKIKTALMNAMQQSMRDKNKARLGALRLALAAIKQVEVDDRIELADDQVIAILDKMVKQRRDSIAQYEAAGRQELAEIEIAEINVIQDFLPTALTDAEITELVQNAISQIGAASMADMGKVMGILRPQVQGRADTGAVSGLVKAALNS